MPRFFFETSQAGQPLVRDDVGELFDTTAEARACAVSKLPIATGGLPVQDGEFQTWTAAVRDERGELVGRFILTFIVDTVAPAGDRVLRSG